MYSLCRIPANDGGYRAAGFPQTFCSFICAARFFIRAIFEKYNTPAFYSDNGLFIIPAASPSGI